MMLSLDTAYRSFGGEVEASSTPTICRLSDSRRHQLSAIALFAAHKPVDRMGYQRENSSRAASIRYVEASRPLGVSVMPQLYVKVADTAPDEPALTAYDKEHAVTYARLLDAEADNADWREVARIVLHIDPTTEPERARLAFDSHLARAKWVARHGYRHLLRDGWPSSET